ncbi:hypothetical protein GCM10011511_05600 [Puia dinghuensis]|uniref:Uncharacterized protein n=1 Tax=Puia dinghuensis TaxID=1792502 RepID=A0A8J2U7Y0_9BACT|nr:hypothetical protein GCM10011511_05600 [Puia dinghuensis]
MAASSSPGEPRAISRRDWRGKYNSTDVFDPKTNRFTRGPELNFERFKLGNSIITLKNGDILVFGGDQHIEQLHDGRFTVVAAFDHPYYLSTATLLHSGDILLAGGYGNNAQCGEESWLFTPQSTTIPLSSR